MATPNDKGRATGAVSGKNSKVAAIPSKRSYPALPNGRVT
jgi:hypothetical protein